jgi:1-acyl-sn-glycerol-3-phosphate acyltransferase
VLSSRWIAAPLSLLFWASCVLIVILWTPAVALFRLFTRRSDPDRYRVGRLFRHTAITAARINPFWDFRVVRKFDPDPRRPYVFVANHASNADPFLISLVPWEMKWLSKKSIFDIPLLGWMMKVAGDVPVRRGDKQSAREAMDALRERLSRRLSVLLFPEGTRSEEGTVGPFREGAFRLAIEAGADVIPLVVAGTDRTLPKHSFVLRPASATVTVLPPVSVAGRTAADADRLAETVRGRIAEELERQRSEEASAATGPP